MLEHISSSPQCIHPAAPVANSGYTLSVCAREKLFVSCACGGFVTFDLFWKPLEASLVTVAVKSINKDTKASLALALTVFPPTNSHLSDCTGL